MTNSSSGGKLISTLRGKIRIEYVKGRLVVVDSSNNIIGLFGYRDDGTVGFDLAPLGVDVRYADIRELIMTDRRNGFWISESGSLTLASPNLAGSSTFSNVLHGLPERPRLVLATVAFSVSGTKRLLPYNGLELVGADAGKVRYDVNFEIVGNDTLTFFYRDIVSATNQTAYIDWYVLEETIA